MNRSEEPYHDKVCRLSEIESAYTLCDKTKELRNYDY